MIEVHKEEFEKLMTKYPVIKDTTGQELILMEGIIIRKSLSPNDAIKEAIEKAESN